MIPRLIDSYNRHLNYLRISITDWCNLRCKYCQPPEQIPKLGHEEILRYEEILGICRIAVAMGINKIRVTGGEPLIRKGVTQFLKTLAALPGLQDLSLTTNGVLLAENLPALKDAGVRRINVSLDTLDRVRFKEITGRDHFQRVWDGILSAHRMGFQPIKINAVALRGINDDELTELARLSFAYPFHIRFIEHMPMGSAELGATRPLLTPEIKTRLESVGNLIPISRSRQDGPAQRYRFEGAQGEVGFISAMSRHFCNTCNRLRLTAAGCLRPCLLSDYEVDIKHALRQGVPEEALVEIFLEAIRHKPSDHHLATRHPQTVQGQMSKIGG
ncbi:MAG: GTP 3',8-cyclase MoaA [Desulfobacterales bacterium]